MGVITFNQLWLLVGVFGFLAIFFFILNIWLWLIAALILVPFALILTFGQMNGLPMYKVIPAALLHFWLPKYYFWKKEQRTQEPKADFEQPIQVVGSSQTQKQLDSQLLDNLSQFLDQ